MKRESFYAIIIVALLVLNFGTLGYLWFGNNKPMSINAGPRHEQKEGPLRFMADELGLDDTQFKSLRNIARNHGKSLDSVQRYIKEARTNLYLLAKGNNLDTVKRNEYLEVIEANESAKHMITLSHFHDIRSILTAEQKEGFNVFIEDMARHMGGGNRGPRRGRGPGPGGPPPPRH